MWILDHTELASQDLKEWEKYLRQKYCVECSEQYGHTWAAEDASLIRVFRGSSGGGCCSRHARGACGQQRQQFLLLVQLASQGRNDSEHSGQLPEGRWGHGGGTVAVQELASRSRWEESEDQKEIRRRPRRTGSYAWLRLGACSQLKGPTQAWGQSWAWMEDPIGRGLPGQQAVAFTEWNGEPG